MTYKALIVEDNATALDNYFDALESLGHTYDVADCQQAAREMLALNEYAYILLDMEIPVCSGRMSRRENGKNLLDEIVDAEGPPVIITTSHGMGDNAWTADLLAAGAANFINKDFPRTGRTLDSLIRKLLTKRKGPRKLPQNQPADAVPKRFCGGKLIFYPDRVELCGIVVVSGHCLIRRILELLIVRRANGRYVTYRGDALADLLGTIRGQNAVAEAIHLFRKQVTAALRAAGYECGPEDVVRSGGPGYRLNEWIEAIVVETPCAVDADDSVAQRRQGVLEELQSGRSMSSAEIEAEFRCSNATVKRDITALRRVGHRIRFEGPTRTGCYRLDEAAARKTA